RAIGHDMGGPGGPSPSTRLGQLLRLCLNCARLRPMADPTPIVDALDRAGYRMTEPRRSLAALIAEQDGHFTAAELVAAAKNSRHAVGRATVFRTLELLEEIGAVERLDLPSGEHAYVGCEPAHHHHVVCSRCGRATEIDDSGLRSVVQDVAR